MEEVQWPDGLYWFSNSSVDFGGLEDREDSVGTTVGEILVVVEEVVYLENLETETGGRNQAWTGRKSRTFPKENTKALKVRHFPTKTPTKSPKDKPISTSPTTKSPNVSTDSATPPRNSAR